MLIENVATKEQVAGSYRAGRFFRCRRVVNADVRRRVVKWFHHAETRAGGWCHRQATQHRKFGGQLGSARRSIPGGIAEVNGGSSEGTQSGVACRIRSVDLSAPPLLLSTHGFDPYSNNHILILDQNRPPSGASAPESLTRTSAVVTATRSNLPVKRAKTTSLAQPCYLPGDLSGSFLSTSAGSGGCGS